RAIRETKRISLRIGIQEARRFSLKESSAEVSRIDRFRVNSRFLSFGNFYKLRFYKSIFKIKKLYF
ncbi:hypothetical protein, partial [Leptospira noguchii]|uniref:hypothetical protein n=1 Tax=Leptospira noguchii TaxID=28182 RepID=UPI001E28A10C